MADPSTRPRNAIFEAVEGSTVHYVCQNGIELEERDFDGELSPPEPIGLAKGGTSGNYIISEEKRTIYCLDQRNNPQDFSYDEDTGEWEPGKLASVNVDAAPETGISAVRTQDGIVYVFYQGLSGEIQALSARQDESWSFVLGLPSTNPLPGASLHSISVRDVIHLFYAHMDNSIHKLSLENGTRSDSQVPFTDGESPKHHIVANIDGERYYLGFADGNNSAFVLEDGSLVEVGKLGRNGFRPSHDAEGWGFGPKKVTWPYP